MPDNEKQVYVDRAAKLKDDYVKQLERWNKQVEESGHLAHLDSLKASISQLKLKLGNDSK